MPGHAPTYTGLGYSELTPTDSISHHNEDVQSTVSSHADNTFSFKFNYGNKTHRFRHEISNFQSFMEVIQQKIMTEHLSVSQSYVAVSGSEDNNDWLTVAYLDDEDDQVLMTSDSDLADAVQIARKSGLDRVRLFVHDALAEAAEQQQRKEESLSESAQAMSDVPLSQPTTLAYLLDASEPVSSAPHLPETPPIIEEKDVQDTEEASRYKAKRRASSKKRDLSEDFNLPIPQDMLLPAAITFLGVVILSVFTISKLTGSSNSRY